MGVEVEGELSLALSRVSAHRPGPCVDEGRGALRSSCPAGAGSAGQAGPPGPSSAGTRVRATVAASLSFFSRVLTLFRSSLSPFFLITATGGAGTRTRTAVSLTLYCFRFFSFPFLSFP